MQVKDALEAIQLFVETISKLSDMKCKIRIVRPKKLFKYYWRNYAPNQDDIHKSGIYLFSDPDDQLLYIGKAASDNMWHEIWGKLLTPSEDSEDMPFFNKSPWVDESKEGKYIKNGDFFITVVICDPSDLASLLEVYLQYLHKTVTADRKLPVFNFRIG